MIHHKTEVVHLGSSMRRAQKNEVGSTDPQVLPHCGKHFSLNSHLWPPGSPAWTADRGGRRQNMIHRVTWYVCAKNGPLVHSGVTLKDSIYACCTWSSTVCRRRSGMKQEYTQTSGQKWMTWLVVQGHGRKMEDEGQGGLGKRHMDGTMGRNIKCGDISITY